MTMCLGIDKHVLFTRCLEGSLQITAGMSGALKGCDGIPYSNNYEMGDSAEDD